MKPDGGAFLYPGVLVPDITYRPMADKKITDKEFLDRLLVDWDLKDKSGNAVIYSERQREELVEDWDGFEAALVQAYFENGRKAREAAEVAKNSELPSATTT